MWRLSEPASIQTSGCWGFDVGETREHAFKRSERLGSNGTAVRARDPRSGRIQTQRLRRVNTRDGAVPSSVSGRLLLVRLKEPESLGWIQKSGKDWVRWRGSAPHAGPDSCASLLSRCEAEECA